MSLDDVNRIIDNFIDKTSRLLPQTFDSEDLLDDLKTHIEESYQDKTRQHPDRDRIELIHEVLDEIGTPEEIADEYMETPGIKDQVAPRGELNIELIARLLFVILFCFVSAYVISYITGFDYPWTVLVLLVFGISEWAIRAKQAGIFKEQETS